MFQHSQLFFFDGSFVFEGIVLLLQQHDLLKQMKGWRESSKNLQPERFCGACLIHLQRLYQLQEDAQFLFEMAERKDRFSDIWNANRMTVARGKIRHWKRRPRRPSWQWKRRSRSITSIKTHARHGSLGTCIHVGWCQQRSSLEKIFQTLSKFCVFLIGLSRWWPSIRLSFLFHLTASETQINVNKLLWSVLLSTSLCLFFFEPIQWTSIHHPTS